MSSRKQNIIEQAICLFNDKGFYNVSLKEIASAMGISPGNVTYYFPKKEDLLREIQEQLIADVDVEIMPKGHITLFHYETITRKHYANQIKYSFYFNNLLYIFKSFPKIAEQYRQVTKERLENGRKLIEYYIATERIIAETHGINYNSLIRCHWMTSIFWAGHEAVLGRGASKAQSTQIEVLWDMLIPYLTEKGRKEYQEICELKAQNILA